MAALAAIRFLLEQCLVVALIVAGLELGWWAAVAFPAALVLVWAVWVAPRSPRRLPDPPRLVLELVLFTATAGALAAAGYVLVAVALGVASAVVAVAVRVTDAPF